MKPSERLRHLTTSEYASLASEVVYHLEFVTVDGEVAQLLIDRPRLLRAYLARWIEEAPASCDGARLRACQLSTAQFRELCVSILRQMPIEVGSAARTYIDYPDQFGAQVANGLERVPCLNPDVKARNTLVMRDCDPVPVLTGTEIDPRLWHGCATSGNYGQACLHGWQREPLDRLVAEGRSLADKQFFSYVVSPNIAWRKYDMEVHLAAGEMVPASLHHLVKFAKTNPGAEIKRLVALAPLIMEEAAYYPAWVPGNRGESWKLIRVDSNASSWSKDDCVLAVKPT